MNIRAIYKKYKKKKQLSAAKSYITIHPDSILGDNFNLELRAPAPEMQYLKIGSHCVIDSSFVFETASGHISIGDRVHIGGGTQLISRNNITIGNDVIIAWGCTVYDHNSHSIHWEERQHDVIREWQNAIHNYPLIAGKDWSVVKDAPITINDKVWIGMGVTILKGVTIGEGAVIGAGSVVTKDIPPFTVVAGNPAQIVRKL